MAPKPGHRLHRDALREQGSKRKLSPKKRIPRETIGYPEIIQVRRGASQREEGSVVMAISTYIHVGRLIPHDPEPDGSWLVGFFEGLTLWLSVA